MMSFGLEGPQKHAQEEPTLTTDLEPMICFGLYPSYVIDKSCLWNDIPLS